MHRSSDTIARGRRRANSLGCRPDGCARILINEAGSPPASKKQ